jgi:RimJ/RimL family protein N-acetyltransferase
VDQKEIDVRYTRILDISYVRPWLYDPNNLKWFSMTTPEEIEQALACWMSFCRYSASLTAVVNRVPCGIATLFLPPYKKVSHHCLFKVCVDPQYQGQGVGTCLIRNLKHLAKTRFKMESIYSEVFEGNPLIHLLEKLDFHEFVRQENYVKSKGHYMARILMQADLREGGLSER